jgi:hypothetical protein
LVLKHCPLFTLGLLKGLHLPPCETVVVATVEVVVIGAFVAAGALFAALGDPDSELVAELGI